ncbi:hypothetical protein CF386_12045 [Paraphotobacterium marinum]|uniref:Porin n=1 Tax=Paraphotobacterium marinum TaxID=1755811 RepID=A0A220VHC4_9GAMM|nr:hypothetical protein [Paraphotobacterium marinum]ASK79767.1 hypothetical protein CF386_12045 [Paraphotobacterium marinum]
MKKTLLALSILAAGMTAANAAELYNQDGTSFSIDGSVNANAAFGSSSQDQSNAYGNTTNVWNGTNNGGDVLDQSWFNFKPTAKSYFNGKDGWYGIGHAYIRFFENSTSVREIWAGIGNDQYGQLYYGKAYTPWNDIASAYDLSLNYSGGSYADPMPFSIGTRSNNQFKYIGSFDNLSVELGAVLGNKGGSWKDDLSNTGSGMTTSVTGGATYAFGDSGFTGYLAGYYAKLKLNEATGFTNGIANAITENNKLNIAGGALGLNYQGDAFGFTLQPMAGKGITSGNGLYDGNQAGFTSSTFTADTLNPNDFVPVAKANFISLLSNVSYQVDKTVFVVQYEYGRYSDIDTNKLGSNYRGDKDQTFNNTILANVNYLWNKQFSTGLEYQYDLLKKDSPYHIGSGAWAQAVYNF